MSFWISPYRGQAVVKLTNLGIRMSDIIESVDAHVEWEAIQTGVVMATGADVPTDIRIGDMVLFSKYDGQLGPSPGNNEQYIVLGSDKIWGKVDVELLQAEIDRRKSKRQAEDEAARASLDAQRRSLILSGS